MKAKKDQTIAAFVVLLLLVLAVASVALAVAWEIGKAVAVWKWIVS